MILKYKFSDEVFYEDFTNMSSISPKNKDTEKGQRVEYYNIRKENKTKFLLFETSNDGYYNFTILQTEEDEYELLKKKKIILIPVICILAVLLIIMIVSLIVYKKRHIIPQENNLI